MLAPQTVLQQRYQIIRLLKTGGMGAVYEAFDLRIKSQVAIKQLTIANLTPNILRAFAREAALLGNLKHPALPRVTDHFSDEHGQFLVMDFVPGPDLEELLQQRGKPFHVNEVLLWSEQLLDALEYLHSQHPAILHRDIKPANLKVATNNQIMLLDFGLAKGSVGQETVAATQHHSILGYTPGYAPLEQIQGTGTSEQSDLYALAATLYHLSTNTPPADALTRAAALINGADDPLKPAHILNSGIPPRVSAALYHALEMGPTQRTPTAKIMRKELSSGPSDHSLNAAILDVPRHSRPSSAGQPTIYINRSNSAPYIPAHDKQLSKPINPMWFWVVTILVVSMLFVFTMYTPASSIESPIIEFDDSFTDMDTEQGELQQPVSDVLNFHNHNTSVQAVAWSPDGSMLASAAQDGVTVKASNGIPLYSFDEPASRLVWHPNGHQLALVSRDTIVLWSINDNTSNILPFEGIQDITALAWSSDGTTLAIASAQSELVQLWNMQQGSQSAVTTGHTDTIESLAWNPGQPLLATASRDTTIGIFDTTGTRITTLNGHTATVKVITWSPDGNKLASAADDGNIIVWSIDGELLETIDALMNTITDLAWNPDSSKLASAGWNKHIRVWRTESQGALLRSLDTEADQLNSLTWNPDGKRIAFATNNGTVQVWEIY